MRKFNLYEQLIIGTSTRLGKVMHLRISLMKNRVTLVVFPKEKVMLTGLISVHARHSTQNTAYSSNYKTFEEVTDVIFHQLSPRIEYKVVISV